MEFQSRFPDEAACRAYLFGSRWPEGYRCPRCGGEAVGAEHRRHLWQCKRCGHQTSVTAGTVMHKTRTPLTLWFWAAYLVATHTPGISAVQLQRQLGIGRYETAWLMLQKLRRAMVAPEREAVPGIPIGATFATRAEVAAAGVTGQIKPGYPASPPRVRTRSLSRADTKTTRITATS